MNYLKLIVLYQLEEFISIRRVKGVFIPHVNFVCGGYTVFMLSIRVSVHATDMDLGAFLVVWR